MPILAPFACLLLAAPDAAGPDPGPLVRALWLVQRYGTADASDPLNDLRTKAALSKALGKDGSLSTPGVKGLMAPETFTKLAGPDGRLDVAEIARALAADSPASRRRLRPAVAEHAAYLTTSFDRIDEPHRPVVEALADWIVANYRPDRPLDIVFVCTGNSRRSILGSTMGNVAAAYYGLPRVRCHSGGTAPTAFNARTVAALKAIGIEVEPTGREAARGGPATANPAYRVRWGESDPGGGPAFEALEFSKRYDDPSNPQSGFAALMVCSEADAACPQVKGAALRVSMPYLDPKIYDGGAYEATKYAERRDDIGRLMLAVMARARHELNKAGARP
jgi:hypothetical protein